MRHDHETPRRCETERRAQLQGCGHVRGVGLEARLRREPKRSRVRIIPCRGREPVLVEFRSGGAVGGLRSNGWR